MYTAEDFSRCTPGEEIIIVLNYEGMANADQDQWKFRGKFLRIESVFDYLWLEVDGEERCIYTGYIGFHGIEIPRIRDLTQ